MVAHRIGTVAVLAFVLTTLTTAGAVAAPQLNWLRQYGTSAADQGFSAVTDGAGNVFVSGVTYAALGGQTYAGAGDVFVAKHDIAGNQTWVRLLGSSSPEESFGVSGDGSGGIVCVGYTSGNLGGQTSAGGSDAFIARFSPDGTLAWTRLLGSPAMEVANAVVVAPSDGSIYVAGQTQGNLDGQPNSGMDDIFLSKWNGSGSRVWTRLLGTPLNDVALSVTVSPTQEIYVAGSTDDNLDGQPNSGGGDAFIAKWGSDGTRLWTRLIGTPSVDVASALTVSPSDGFIYVCGYTQGNLHGQPNSGLSDIFLSKWDSSGSRVWTRLMGTSLNDVARSVAVSPTPEIFVAGSTEGSLDGQPNGGSGDGFLQKWNSDGTPAWTRLFGSSAEDVVRAVAVYGAGAVAVAGYTSGALGGAPSGGYDVFVARMVDASGVPAASGWGLSIAALALLLAGLVVIRRRSPRTVELEPSRQPLR